MTSQEALDRLEAQMKIVRTIRRKLESGEVPHVSQQRFEALLNKAKAALNQAMDIIEKGLDHA